MRIEMNEIMVSRSKKMELTIKYMDVKILLSTS